MIRITLSLPIVLVAASSAFAGDGSQGFSDSDIRGSYGLLAQGNSVVPGTQIAFPGVVVGRLFSDGKGNLQGTGTVNTGGPVSGLGPGQSVTITGTYDVDTDGTGDFTASAAAASPSSATSSLGDPPSIQLGGALVIESFDTQVQLLSTETNRVLYTSIKKQFPPPWGFSDATLRGAWGFACHGALVTSTGDPPSVVQSPVAVVGLMNNDGNGNFSAEVTANTNGVVSQETFTGMDRVADDGTITATANTPEPLMANLTGVIDNIGEFRVITTDPGTIVSCTFNVQGSSGFIFFPPRRPAPQK